MYLDWMNEDEYLCIIIFDRLELPEHKHPMHTSEKASQEMHAQKNSIYLIVDKML